MKRKTAASNPYSIPSKAKVSPSMASRIRAKADKSLGRAYVKPDKDSAAGAAT